MIDLAILGLLKEQEQHGYELRKRVADLLGSARGGMSFGSLYPALARLEKAGHVKAVEANTTVRPVAVPSSGSLAGELAAFRARHPITTPGGRSRKAYGITERGEAHLHELLTDGSAGDDRTFALQLAFCRHLAPDERVDLVRAPPGRADHSPGRAPHRRRPQGRPARPLPAGPTRARHRIHHRRPRLARSAHRRRAGRPIGGTTDEQANSKIRLAIAGVGNCASSLVQGIEYYKNADPDESVPGLMHVVLGGYHVGDVELVAAFDVDANKVGLDTSKAIFAGQNNTIRFSDVPHLGVEVQRAPTFDGFGEFYRQMCEESPAAPVDVAQVLRDSRGRCPGLLPAGRLGAGAEVLRPGVHRRRRRLRERHPGVHRVRPRVGGEVRGRRRADHR